jgi:aspartyl-tRNA synthetase
MTIPKKFNRMTFSDAMEIYGSDKPDMRFAMPMVDVIDIFANSTNEIFANCKRPKKNRIKALRCPNGDNIFSKRQMKGFEDYVRKFGAHGLGYFQMKEDGLKGPLTKFFSESDLEEIVKRTNLKLGMLYFFGAGDKKTVMGLYGTI